MSLPERSGAVSNRSNRSRRRTTCLCANGKNGSVRGFSFSQLVIARAGFSAKRFGRSVSSTACVRNQAHSRRVRQRQFLLQVNPENLPRAVVAGAVAAADPLYDTCPRSKFCNKRAARNIDAGFHDLCGDDDAVYGGSSFFLKPIIQLLPFVWAEPRSGRAAILAFGDFFRNFSNSAYTAFCSSPRPCSPQRAFACRAHAFPGSLSPRPSCPSTPTRQGWRLSSAPSFGEATLARGRNRGPSNSKAGATEETCRGSRLCPASRVREWPTSTPTGTD